MERSPASSLHRCSDHRAVAPSAWKLSQSQSKPGTPVGLSGSWGQPLSAVSPRGTCPHSEGRLRAVSVKFQPLPCVGLFPGVTNGVLCSFEHQHIVCWVGFRLDLYSVQGRFQ